eukprot:gene10027-7917_t
MSESNPGGAQLSFGFKRSNAKAKVAVNVKERLDEHREAIISIEGGVIKTDAPKESTAAVKVIPRIENTYKTGGDQKGKFTPSFRPPANDAPVQGDGEDKFEMAPVAAPQITSYGLLLRGRGEAEPSEDRAGLGGSITQRLTAKQQDEKKYKEEVENMPEEASLEDYEDMPIEDFGKAMLRGMGWQEGMGVGRNRKVVEAIEYLKRPERLGLGAQPQAAIASEADKKKVKKMGDKETVRREDMVLAPDADGRQRHIRKLDEKLVGSGPQPGKAMAIIDGRHKGLACTVFSLLPKEEDRSERCTVRLAVNDEVIEVRCKELGEAWEGKKKQRSDHSKGSERSAKRGSDRHQEENVLRGKAYLKKGTVIDVHPGPIADVSMDDSRDVIQVKQSGLETVIPKADGAAVLVVLGKLKGQKARLLKSKSSSGAAAVQLAACYSVHRLMLEEVCEYCGNMDEDD